MFIELVETLRCVREHDESWLVASIDELRERSIRRGTLGCPLCGAQYPIANGVADFSAGAAPAPFGGPPRLAPGEIALRAGAFLGPGNAGGTVILGGEWALGAAELTATLDVRGIAVNAPPQVAESAAVALVGISNVVPLAPRSCAGAALDGSFSAEAYLSAQRVLRAAGRIVGAKAVAPSPGLAIIADDESWWIGQTQPEITALRRGNR